MEIMKKITALASVIAAVPLLVLLAEAPSQGETVHPDAVDKARRILITVEMLDQMSTYPGDIWALPAVPVPPDNAMSPDKIELGKMLFFDARLSGDNSISCAFCHNPKVGFGDARPRAIGFKGMELGRHSPTIINAAYNGVQFWDGRAKSLEDQATMPIQSTVEMNSRPQELVKKLNGIPEYRERFQRVFGEGPSMANISKAIASFERTVTSGDSPFDRYARGDKRALTTQEKRGLILFISKAACTQCHNGPNFTDNKFHNISLPQVGPLKEDLGRYQVTKKSEDRGAFKTPTLRNVVLTAPYMHDGAFRTLEEVVDFYNQGGGESPNKSPKIFKLNLTDDQKKDLIAFLKTLTGSIPEVSVPKLPRS